MIYVIDAIVYIAFLLLIIRVGVSTCRRAVRAWRDPHYAATAWPVGRGSDKPEVLRGHARGLVPFAAFTCSIITGFFVGIPLLAVAQTRMFGRTLIVCTITLFFLSPLLHFTIVWFNWPRILALPHMRDDVGTVTARLRRRRAKRQRRRARKSP